MYEAKLQLRLESGEPKCANCEHWSQNGEEPFGNCMRGVDRDKPAVMWPVLPTTDLTVCSKWQQKD